VYAVQVLRVRVHCGCRRRHAEQQPKTRDKREGGGERDCG
jgi:hypothetical protein